MKRETLARFGRRGNQVRVVFDPGEDRHVVYYRDVAGGERRRKFGADSRGKREAIAWAEAFHVTQQERATRGTEPKPITVRELWLAFQSSPAWDDLRDATRRNYADRWARWERFIGAEALAGETSLINIDQFITRSRQVIAINQVRQALNVARIVYRWGQLRRLIRVNDFALHRWKTPKDAVVHEPEEYTRAEFERLLFSMSPQDPRRWRLHVALMLAGSQGQRARAVRHLRWADIDPVLHRIVWPAEFQKTGALLEQPLTWDAVAALETARYWLRVPTGRDFTRMNRRQRLAADALSRSPWVLPGHGGPDKPYTYQALWVALREAEVEARVEHRPYRALHGLRKMIAGDVADRTGDARLGMEWIGDRDDKQMRKYLKRRGDRLRRAADSISSRNSPDGSREPNPTGAKS